MKVSIMLLLLVVVFTGCSQEGEVEVYNATGGNLGITINGSSYNLFPRSRAKKEIEIGRKFIFGPDEEEVSISGSGECRFDFYKSVTVKNDDVYSVSIYGNAGHISVDNNTSEYMYLYLSPCTDPDWPSSPDDMIAPYYTTNWKVSDGCWDLKCESASYGGTEYDIYIDVCETDYFVFGPYMTNAGDENQDRKIIIAIENAGFGGCAKDKIPRENGIEKEAFIKKEKIE